MSISIKITITLRVYDFDRISITILKKQLPILLTRGETLIQVKRLLNIFCIRAQEKI